MDCWSLDNAMSPAWAGQSEEVILLVLMEAFDVAVVVMVEILQVGVARDGYEEGELNAHRVQCPLPGAP